MRRIKEDDEREGRILLVGSVRVTRTRSGLEGVHHVVVAARAVTLRRESNHILGREGKREAEGKREGKDGKREAGKEMRAMERERWRGRGQGGGQYASSFSEFIDKVEEVKSIVPHIARRKRRVDPLGRPRHALPPLVLSSHRYIEIHIYD